MARSQINSELLHTNLPHVRTVKLPSVMWDLNGRYMVIYPSYLNKLKFYATSARVAGCYVVAHKAAI